jgi:hypothetical protein
LLPQSSLCEHGPPIAAKAHVLSVHVEEAQSALALHCSPFFAGTLSGAHLESYPHKVEKHESWVSSGLMHAPPVGMRQVWSLHSPLAHLRESVPHIEPSGSLVPQNWLSLQYSAALHWSELLQSSPNLSLHVPSVPHALDLHWASLEHALPNSLSLHWKASQYPELQSASALHRAKSCSVGEGAAHTPSAHDPAKHLAPALSSS